MKYGFLILVLALISISEGALAADDMASSACAPANIQRALSLDDVINLALCHNPQTRYQWATVQAQSALVDSARSPYFPSLTASAGSTQNQTALNGQSTSASNNQKIGLSANYILYDFGGRAASLESAQQTLTAVDATRDASLQAVYLSTVQSYFSLLSARANVDALKVAEGLAQGSLAAAQARYQSGAATPADKLQAQTALSQAKLNRITADGNVSIAAGTLANQLGFSPTQTIELAPTNDVQSDPLSDKKIGDLITDALRIRPDLLAADAQIKVAQAQIEVNRASGMPTLNLTAGSTYSADSIAVDSRNDSLGVTLSVPLFTGYRVSNQVKSAEAQKQAKIADRERVAKQVELDVWKTYQTLQTNSQSLLSATDLVASAEQSERMTSGRYKAGLGTMIDVLTAQNILVGARQQLISARFNFIASRFALAQAMGQLDSSNSEVVGETFRAH
jgi:TolC family type I secretion outer membrane protein